MKIFRQIPCTRTQTISWQILLPATSVSSLLEFRLTWWISGTMRNRWTFLDIALLQVSKFQNPRQTKCFVPGTFISLFTFASILTIVLLTAERFTAICYPFSHRTIFDEKRVKRFILLIWFVALLPSIFIGSMVRFFSSKLY